MTRDPDIARREPAESGAALQPPVLIRPLTKVRWRTGAILFAISCMINGILQLRLILFRPQQSGYIVIESCFLAFCIVAPFIFWSQLARGATDLAMRSGSHE